MRLINKLAIIGSLLFVAVFGTACDKDKFKNIVEPEVKVIMREVRIAMSDNANIPQCKNQVYQIEGVFNDDSRRFLTDEEISKYVKWEIPAPSHNQATTWTCDNYNSSECNPPNPTSDIMENTNVSVPWHRCLNRIRFDQEGTADIKITYKDPDAGPFFSERTVQIQTPELVKIDVDPTSEAGQLRGDETRAANPSGDSNDGVFGVSDNGVCEGIKNYQAGKLVVGCVKRFAAKGTYDNDETRDITNYDNVLWLEDSTLDATSDKPAELYSETMMAWPYDGDKSFQNKAWYSVTYNYLTNNVSADSKKSMFFGLRPNTFRAEASMDGIKGYSGVIEVVEKNILGTEIVKPQKDPTFDFIEEQVIQLRADGFYDNDTTENITTTVTWGSKDQSKFIIRPEDSLGQIYAKPFFKNSDSAPPPTAESIHTAVVKANISGLPDSTIDLKVRQKRLKYVDIEIQGIIGDTYTITYNQKAPMTLWAVYDNNDTAPGVTVAAGVNKKNVAACDTTNWISYIRNDVAVVINTPSESKCQLNTDGDKGNLLGKSVEGSGNIIAKFTGANTIDGPNVEMSDTVRIMVQQSGSRTLKGIQITPRSTTVIEGEKIVLNLWNVYDDQTMRMASGQTEWQITQNPGAINNINGMGDATIDVRANNVDDVTEVKVRAKHPDVGWSEEISIFINDVRLRSVGTSLIKPWVTDIAGDFVELSVLGTFGGFVKNADKTRIAAGDSTADSTIDHVRLLMWYGGTEKEVTFDYNPAYIKNIAYDGVKGVFKITPQDISTDSFITTDITVATAINPTVNILKPINPSYTQKEFRKTVSLKIYDSIKVYFESPESSFSEDATARVKLRLSHVSDQNIHIPFSFLPGASHPASGDGVDYDDGIGWTAMIPVGDTSVDIVFNLIDDAIGEYPETVKLKIRAADLVDATVDVTSSHILTINDNDAPLVYFDSPSLYVNEVSGDTTPKIRLKLSKISDVTASVNYSVDISDASSTVNGADYSDLKGGNIKIQPGQKDASFDIVKIINDSLHEIDEYLVLKIIDVTIDLTADRTSGVLGFDTTTDADKPTRQLITIVDNDYFNIAINGDSTSLGHTAINASGDHLITNTGNYYFKPYIPVDTTDDYPKVFSFYNTPDWATYDINTGVLQGKSGKPSRYEVGTYPANFDKVTICVSDATDDSGSETSCLEPFDIKVRTCLSSQNGSIRQNSTFGGDINCGKVDNHVTAEDHTVDWSSPEKFSGIVLIEEGGALKLSGLVDGDITSGAYVALRGGSLQVVGDSSLNASAILEVSADSTIDVAGGQTLTYKGPSLKIESRALNIPGDGTIDATAGVVMNNASLLRLSGSGGAIIKVDVSGDSTIDVGDEFTINNLAVPNNKLKLSGSGHLALNAVVNGTIDTAPNGKLSGKITGVGELDVSGDTLTLGGDLTIDINKLTSGVDTTIDIDARLLEWDGRGGLNNILKGKVIIDNQGVFRLIDNTADISADIRLNGGRLEVNQSAVFRKDITVDADSVIKTPSSKTLTYKGSAVELVNHTLALEGLGNINSDSTAFTIKPAGRLRIDGNPKLQKPIRLSGGALEINNDCTIDQNFALDLVESTIQLNSDQTLDYTPTASLDINNNLRLTGSGFLNNTNTFRLGNSGVLKIMDGGKIDKVEINSDSAKVRTEGLYTINSLIISSNIGKIELIDSSGDLTVDGNFAILSNKTLDITADGSGRKISFPNGLSLAGGILDINQSMEVSGDISLNVDSSLDVLSGKTLTYNGAFSNIDKKLSLKGGGDVSNGSPLIIDQNGVLRIEASSDIKGPVQLSGGKLALAHSAAISGNMALASDSTIDILSSHTLTYNGSSFDIGHTLFLIGGGKINNANPLILNNNGVLQIDAGYDIQGPVSLSGGKLQVNQTAVVSGSVTQYQDSTIDVFSGRTLTYTGSAVNVSNLLKLTGGGAIDDGGAGQTFANIEPSGTLEIAGVGFNMKSDASLDGGRLYITADSTIDGNITQTADSTIDVSSDKILSYQGASLRVGDYILYLAGSGRVDNVYNIILCDKNSQLLFRDHPALSVGKAEVQNCGADFRIVDIKVKGDATIDSLIMSHDISVDIDSTRTLRVDNNSFDIAAANFFAGGSGSLRFKNLRIFSGGFLTTSGNGYLYADISADSGGTLNAGSGTYYLAGSSLYGTINLSDSRVNLDGDLNISTNNLTANANTDISTDGYALSWNSDDALLGRVTISSGGKLRVHGVAPSSIGADIALNGGTLDLDIGVDMTGDLSHTASSTVDIAPGQTLNYTGNSFNIGPSLLSLSGKITNVNDLILNDQNGKLLTRGIDSSIDNVKVTGVGGFRPIEVDVSSSINAFNMTGDTSIDISSNRSLTIGGGFVIPANKILRVTGDGDLIINGLLTLTGGALEFLGNGDLRADILGDADSKLKIVGDGQYYLQGNLAGKELDLSDATVILDGNLTIGGADLTSDKDTRIITGAHTLIWNGKGDLDGKITVNSGGALKVDNSGPADGTMDATVDLNGGGLIISVDTTMDGDLIHSAPSYIQVTASDVTFDYNGSLLNIGPFILSLTGPGRIDNSGDFKLNEAISVLRCAGADGKISRVSAANDSTTDAKILVEEDFTIARLDNSTFDITIDISSNRKLSLIDQLSLASGKRLRLVSSSDTTTGELSLGDLRLNGGTLEVRRNLVISSVDASAALSLASQSTIDVGDKSLIYKGAAPVDVSAAVLILTGSGKLDSDGVAFAMVKSSLGKIQVDGVLDLSADINLAGGYLDINQTIVFSGNITKAGADSTIDVLSGKTLTYRGSEIDISSGSLSLIGDGTIDDAGLSLAFADISNDGILEIAGNLDISGDIILKGGTLKVVSSPTIYGNILQKGDASVDVLLGYTLTYKGAPWKVDVHTLSLTGGGTLVNNNKLSLNEPDGLLVLSGDGSMDALAIDLTADNRHIRVDNDADFKIVSLDINEDASIDISGDKTLTIVNPLLVPTSKKLCVTGPGKLLMNGGLILQGDLCAGEQSTWSVDISDVSFDGGSISGGGDASSRNYKARGVLSGEADLRGVVMVLAGDLNIQNASLIKSDSSTHVAIGSNTLKWDGKGGAINGLIDVSNDGTFDISDSAFNDASIDATVNLAGGVWKVYINTHLRGDLIHSLDSSIDVLGSKTLKYTGSQMNIGGQSGGLTLSLIGSGSIDNSADATSHTFKFDDSASILSCDGDGGRVSRVDVSNDLNTGKILIGVNNFTIQHLGHSNLIKVDVGSGFRLNITDPLELATGDTLNFIAAFGGGDVSFDGGLRLRGGKLDVSQDLNVSAGNIEVTGDATSVINVADNKAFLYGNTLEVSGDNTLSLGGPIDFNIRLAGGALAVESSADLNEFLTHTASSDINVSSGAVLNYKKDASMDIGPWTLSLTGSGAVNTSPGGFCLDTPNSILNLSGADGTIDRVDILADLTGAGKIKVEADFKINGLNKLPGQTTVIDISPDVTLTAGNFIVNTGEKLKFISDSSSGSGVLSGNLNLNGGELILVQNLIVSGDITQDADSTIDVTSDRALTYSGANWFIGPHALYLAGSGRIKNADNIVLNHPDSRLWLTGVDGSIDSIDISVDGAAGYRSIESKESFKIGRFTLSKDTSIDIANAKILKVLNGFSIPNGVTLKVTGDGTLDVNGQLITLNSGGVFRPSTPISSAAQYFNVNSASGGTFDATGGVYYLRGNLAGTVKLSNSTITLDNDLNIANATLSSSGAEISTSGNTLTWDGSSALNGVVRINESGTFTVSGAGTIGSVIYLSGGVLDIDAATTMNGDLIHDASSSIDVSQDVTFTYQGASMDINPLTLSLTGPGVLQNSAHAFLLNKTQSVLKCSGSGGKIAQVGVAAASAVAGIDIDHNFRIDQLDWDATADLAAVDIGPSYELTVGNSLELPAGKTLRFMNSAVGAGKLTLMNGLLLNGGLLDVDQSLDVSGDFRQKADSTIDIVAGKFMNYKGKALDLSHDAGNDLTLHLTGDSSLDISLDGGILHVKGPAKLYGDITHITDSTVDLSSDIIYGGEAININGYTLSFTGTSRFDNSGDNGKGKLVLNDKDGKLWLKGTSIYVGWVEATDSTSAVAVAGDATIDKFAMTEDISIDINNGFTLTVNKGFVVPNAKRLILHGEGGTFTAKDATVELQNGTLETALKGNLYMDISMDSNSRFKRGAGPVSQQDNKYWLKGILSGNIDLSGAHVNLIGDLNFAEVTELDSELSLFSTEDHTFDWGGDTLGGWSPIFRGSLDISADGAFRVSQGPLELKNNENLNYLRLSGGSLVINANSCAVDMSIDHAVSSDIKVASGVTFNINKAQGAYDFKIGEQTLSLTGPGYIAGSAYILFDSPAGVLRLAGANGRVKQVKIPQSLGVGKLDVDTPFMVETLSMDGLSSANVNIDISSDASLDVEATVDVSDANSLTFLGRDGTFDADLSFNGGKLIIQEDSVFRGDILHQGNGEINFGSNNKTLTYKGKLIEIGANTLTLTGDGSFDNNNNNPIFLDHKDSKLYLSNSAWARLIKIGGDLNGNSLIDMYVNEDATIDAFDMSQDSNIQIAAGRTLTIDSSVDIPENKRLIITGGGVLKVNGAINLAGGGSLLPSENSSFYADQSGTYHMAGVLTGGALNLEDKKVVLEGNLTINIDNLVTNGGTDISTGAHILTWNGQSPLHGKIHVQSGGKFKITGGGNTMDATIDLDGGFLDVDYDLTVTSDINALSDASIDVADGVIFVYEGSDISVGTNSLSLIGPGFFYNDKDNGGNSYIVMDQASGVLRLSGDNGIVNKVKVSAGFVGGKVLAENDYVIMRLLLAGSPFKVEVAANKNLIVGEELKIAGGVDSTVDISGAGRLVLHDVIMEASLDLNPSGSNLELAPDSTLRVLNSSTLASKVDLEFGDGLYIAAAKVLTVEDLDNSYTLTFGGGVTFAGIPALKPIVLVGDESLVFNDPVAAESIISLVDIDGVTTGTVSPNPASVPEDVFDFKAQAGDKQVNLSWNYHTSAVTEIRICRSTSTYPTDATTDCGGLFYDITTDTSYVDNDVTNDVRYYYTAFGRNVSNGSYSPAPGVKSTAVPTFVSGGLVGYYRFDDAPSGKVMDDSGFGNEGLVFGAFEQTSDMKSRDNKAYVFDGVDDYFEIDNPFESTVDFNSTADAFSLSLWMKADQSNGDATTAHWHEGNSLINGRVKDGDKDFGLTIAGGQAMFGTGGATPKTIRISERLDDGHWHNITAVRWLNGDIKLYLNGELADSASGALAGQYLTLPAFLGIGGRPFGGKLYKGYLDEVRLYNRDLTAADIKKLYAQSQKMAAYYRLDNDGSDDSGFDNHGTTNNVDSSAGINAAPNTAYQFNGSSSYLQVAGDSTADFKPTKEISYSLWAYLPSGKSGTGMCDSTRDEVLLSTFENKGGYEMYCNKNFIGARIYTDGSSDALDISCDISLTNQDLSGDWHNIVIAYRYDDNTGDAVNSGNLSIYFDGVGKKDSSVNTGDISYDGSTPLIIGADASDGAGPLYFRGKIDEVKIYERALSATEVENLYKSVLVDAPSLEVIDSSANKVSWNNVSGIDAYKLYRSVAADGSYNEISSDDASPYLDNNVTAGTLYYYKLVLCNSGVCSARSAPVSLTTDAAPVPGSSGDITGDNLRDGWFTLSWAAASDVLDPSVDLQYKVVMSTNDINTVGKCEEASVDIVQDWTYNMTAKAVSLPLNAEYYLNVLVKDLNGNKDVYKSRKMKISFEESHSLATIGATDWEFFTIGGNSYLAVADASDGATHNSIDSKIYKWNSGDSSFDHFQDISADGAVDWEFFTIDGDSYLALANHRNDATYDVISKIYKWNDASFDSVQEISSDGATDWEFFTIDNNSYLAMSNYRDASTYNVKSKIYKWNGSSWDHSHDIASSGAQDWEFFTIGNDSYLALANQTNGSDYDIVSKIYKWNDYDSSFDSFQDITSDGAIDWEFFTIGGDSYLALANHTNGLSYNLDSKIYKWMSGSGCFGDGSSCGAHFQPKATKGARDWKYFTIAEHSYLAIANYADPAHDIDSWIYRWNGSSFVDSQSIATSGATDWKYFNIGGADYLAVSNQYNGSSYTIDSKIYKLKLSLF